MRLLRSVARRPFADTALVAHAAAVHLAVAGLLRIVGLRRTRTCLARRPEGPPLEDSETIDRRIIWAVRTATHLVPVGRTCLTEALTAQHLLRRRGHDAALRFGVVRPTTRPLDAHAWLERAGSILIGAETAASYEGLTASKESA